MNDSQPNKASDHNVDELMGLALELGTQAAELLIKSLGETRTSISTKTSSTDMVSEIDRASEKMVVDGIRAARPNDAILGEEGTNSAGTTGVRWVIDPLDGTTNYLYGLPGFAVSIGIEIDGVTEIGVVIDPSHNETFVARRGHGASRNGELISCNKTSELANALVATGFGYESTRRAEQAQVVAALLSEVRDIRRVGAAAIDLCWVACGRVDAYYERGPMPWDHSAGLLIASEAGASTLWTEVGWPSGDLIVAAAPDLFESILAHVQPSSLDMRHA